MKRRQAGLGLHVSCDDKTYFPPFIGYIFYSPAFSGWKDVN